MYPRTSTKPSTHVCDSCGWEASGYTRQELERDGWKWNPLTDDDTDKRRFVMCSECVAYFAERRVA